MTAHGEFRDRPVRPYVITRGRARPSRNTIRPETLLITADTSQQLPVYASREERALLRICARLVSLAEAATRLELPVSVVSVVASDLVDTGHLLARSGIPQAVPPDHSVLREVLNGLRNLR